MTAWLVRQCEVCKVTVRDRELGTVRYLTGDQQRRSHMGCMPDDERRKLFRQSALKCIFCAEGGMTMPMLIDHFSRRHGRVISNW